MTARLARVALVAALMMLTSLAFVSPAAAQGAGDVRMVKRTDSAFDRFTSSPSEEHKRFMQQRYWRMEVFTPYWDAKLSWYPNGWFYSDLYAIYVDSDLAREHPEWILRDGAGNRLYIPWGCGGGRCPQYAADVGNPDFRRYWIDSARATMRQGYRGVWVDDVNMEFRVGNGNGDEVAPTDPRTGRQMTAADWRRYVAEFTEQITAGLPAETEILHNSIWYGGNSVGRDRDPYVKRQIRASDYINVERGVNDGGLTGGTGDWSLNALLAYIDRVHAEGKGVVLDSWIDSDAEREYGLASYFLISSGRDGIGNYEGSHPDDWWRGYDASLGAALGPRRTWNGLLRRDFERGIVLVNEPQAPRRTVTVGAGFSDVYGRERATVSLGPAQGIVLAKPGNVGAGPGAGTDTGTGRRRTKVRLRPRVGRFSQRAARGSKAAGRSTTRRVRGVRLTGRVLGAQQGAIRMRLRRRSDRGWKTVGVATVGLGSGGGFGKTFLGLPRGAYRAQALFDGSADAEASRSPLRRFRLHR